MALLAQWRADQEVYEDTGGTNAAEDTDAVASWGVYAGTLSASLATQSTSGRMPVYASNDGGYPSLTFSNTNKSSLLLAHSSDWLVSAVSWLAVIKPTKTTVSPSGSGNGTIFGKGSSWTNFGCHISQMISGINTPPNMFWFHTGYTTRTVIMSTADSAASWQVIWGIADGACIKSGVNRQSAVRTLQSQTIALGTNAVAIGADADNTAYAFTGSMREIAFWDTALSETDMATEVDAAMTRWGISNSVSPPSSGCGIPIARGMHGGMR
jgi:hypothetical protein